MMQRKALIITMCVLVFCIGLISVKIAECADATSSVSVSATVLASATLTTQAKNVSDDQPVSGIGFGNVAGSAIYAVPTAYIEIAYNSGETNWALEVYTNNTNWTGGSGDRGGLIGQNNTNIRAPLLWQAHDDSITSHPALNQTEVDAGHWTWVKDKGDPDWATSSDYRQVLSGNIDHTWLHGYPGGNGQTSAVSPVAVYLGGKFDGKPVDAYSTTIVLDLYHW
jgi:hypothetical protein